MERKRIIHQLIAVFSILVLATVQAPLHAQQSNLRRYLDEKKWDELFPHRIGKEKQQGKKQQADFCSFKALLAAADSFPKFLSHPDPAVQKRELCAFLANIAKETGGLDEAPGGYYKWGLVYIQEVACANGCPQYSDPVNQRYPPVQGQSYHGRGPMQISWNYNYGQFSEYYFRDKNVLLKDPSLVAKNGTISFASALWFWTSTQYPKPSCNAIMTGSWTPTARDSAAGRLPGFGAVVNVINGGIDCGPKGDPDTKYRYGYYRYLCNYFKVDPGPNIECYTQCPFGQ